MNIFLTYIITLVLSLGLASNATAQTAGNSNVNTVQKANVSTRWTADTLYLSFALSETIAEGSSNYAVWTMPRIANAKGDTLSLCNAVFRGKRNRQYVERERYFSTKGNDRKARNLNSATRSSAQPASHEVMFGDTVRYAMALTRERHPWLWQNTATLNVNREKEGCCSTEDLATATIALLRYVPPFVPKLNAVADNTGKAGELEKNNPLLCPYSQYRPYTKDRILRKEKGALYVHFELDKAVLRHDYRGNSATLDRIVDITRQIMADSTSNVRVIQIIGLASVEGAVKHNEQLAGARGEALKRYIQKHIKVDDSMFDVANGGEAWTELRSQIEDLQFDGRDEMLSIIDTESNVNLRERKLKTLHGGKPYSFLREKVLADQRNSGYLRIYYDYVPDTAAATINRATELINSSSYDEALTLLNTVKNDRRAYNALGVALYMTGKHAEGMEYIRRAADDGNAEAQDNLRQWEAIKKAEQ